MKVSPETNPAYEAAQRCKQIADGVKAFAEKVAELISHQNEVPALRSNPSEQLASRGIFRR